MGEICYIDIMVLGMTISRLMVVVEECHHINAAKQSSAVATNMAASD